MTEIIGKTAEEVWKKALKHVIENGSDYRDKNMRGCREWLNLVLRIEGVDKIEKPIEILNSFGKWVYPPMEEIKAFIMSKKKVPGYYYNYGARAFNFNALNQIEEYVIPLLKKYPVSKRAVVLFYKPDDDSYLDRKETPGMIMMNFNLRKGKLHATTIIRSNDLFYGWPGNICQTFILAEYVGKAVGCGIGTINTISVSAHIFDDQFDDIRRVLRGV